MSILKYWRMLFLGGLLLFSVHLFSCASSSECTKNADCPNLKRICLDGTCVQCRKDLDCAKEERCQNNICVKKKLDELWTKEKNEDILAEKETNSDVSDVIERVVEKTILDEAMLKETSFKEEIPFEDAGNIAEETISEKMRAEEASKEKIPETCSKGMVFWQGQCYTAEEYCKKRFGIKAQKHIDKHYDIVYDSSGVPTFCKTALGSYYLPGQGYSFCDQDADGWISLEAYRAYTSLDKAIQTNARCHLLTIKAVIYHVDNPNTQEQIQLFKRAIPLIETYRNDGGGNIIERPIYTQDQRTIPKNKGTSCQTDSDCKFTDGELCYIGHCIKAKRFQPVEVNTLTKACIKNSDLNDNQLDDVTETPSDLPTPKMEFKPLLKLGYFVELNYGYYQKDYNIGGGAQIPVFHIVERSRRAASDQRGLALKCGQASQGDQVDYWKYCYLKDDQRCKSSNGQFKKGLSLCQLENIHHATRSLFKCVVFDGQKDASQYYFHPNNFGLSKKYTRTTCSLKGSLKLSAKNQHDVEFSCTIDKKAPDLSQDEVGWACVSFHHYGNPKDYLAGCIDECSESKKVSGAALPCGENDHCTPLNDSYGKGKFACKSNLKGPCAAGTNYCKWGKFDTCIATTKPKNEICNGFDEDCDGQIDNGCPTKLMKSSSNESINIGKIASLPCLLSCPSHYVLTGIGMTFNENSKNINTIEIFCHQWSLNIDKTRKPYQYSISLHSKKTNDGMCKGIQEQGSQSFVLNCPANQVVVGIEGRDSPDSFQKLRLLCAKLFIKGNTAKHYKIQYGPVSKTVAIGLSGGKKSFYKLCPQGYKGGQIFLFAKSGHFKGMQFKCVKLLLSQ